MDQLRCVVERITYQNEDNGFSVIKCRAKGYSDLVTVVGGMPEVHVGSVLILGGNWRVDAKYGQQFSVETFEETLPATVFGIEKYLGSGLVKGVGPKFAGRIVRQFGADTLRVIDEEPDRLLEVSGIGRMRVDRIKASWEQQKEIKNIMLFLQSHDVSTSHATKIYKTYGNESIQVVSDNPYRMADEIWGIGFRTADTIAQKLGFGKDKYVRLRAGLLYTLNHLADDGHCYATRELLVSTGAELLDIGQEMLDMTLDEMIRVNDVITEVIPKANPKDNSKDNSKDSPKDNSKENPKDNSKDSPKGNYKESGSTSAAVSLTDEAELAIYLPPFYYSEVGVSRRLLNIFAKGAAIRIPAEGLAERIQRRTGMVYDEIQKQAIEAAVRSKILILTGGPGTGKTTTTLGIITAFREAGAKILLAAPTGRAAKRLSEATGLEAKTIHRLLESKPPEGYQRNENNPLEGDVLILDECSMIDIMLMYNLLKAIPEDMTLIFVGDIDQLPSVGAGNVLRDIIDSEQFPVVRLTRIFRQAQTSRIIMNAHRINSGMMPDLSNGAKSDFFFMEREEPEVVTRTIVDLVCRKLPRYYHVAPTEIQVLTPMQRGVIGTGNLNQVLQQELNASASGLRRGGYEYKPRDKVMQIRNNYDKEVFNGDIGVVESVDLEERELAVRFEDRRVTYDVSELDELVLAYATTIHKSQGSEYPIVVIPVLMSHYIMLQRNLIYTGITRAKKALVLVGTKQAIARAVNNVTVTERHTLLKERLRKEVGGNAASSNAASSNAASNNEASSNAASSNAAGNNASRALKSTGNSQRGNMAGSDVSGGKGSSTSRGVVDSAVISSADCIAEAVAPYGGQEVDWHKKWLQEDLFVRISRSSFRNRFSLTQQDRNYIAEKGMDTLRSHAADIIRKRLAPAEPLNDGKQTPMRGAPKGHPVFIGQHATGTCCRGCLEKWHGIPKGRAMTEEEQAYVVDVLMQWITRQLAVSPKQKNKT